MPEGSELAGFYPPAYHSMAGQGVAGRLRHGLRSRRLTSVTDDPGPVLDFGCGNGDFLVHLARRLPEREYYGYELGPTNEVLSLAGGAVTVVRGEVSALLERLPPCAVISLHHVVEHLPDPVAVLSQLAERLLPGGFIEGQTPAAGSLEHRVFKDRWSGYHAPRHTVVFSARGLAASLTRAGLVDVEIRRAVNPAAVAVSLASLRRGNDGGHIARRGAPWLGWLAMAAVLAPIDLLSGAPGVVDFRARRAAV